MKRINVKKLVAFAMALCMCAVMAGCGSSDDSSSINDKNSAAAVQKNESTAVEIQDESSAVETQKDEEDENSTEENDDIDTAVDTTETTEPAAKGEFEESSIPVLKTDSEDINSLNLGMCSGKGADGGGFGYGYNYEERTALPLTLSDLKAYGQNMFEKPEEKLVYNNTDNGFVFDGTAYQKYVYDEDNNVVPDEEDTMIYLELSPSAEGEDPEITAFGFDYDHYNPDQVNFTCFGLQDFQHTKYFSYFMLGDKRADIEEKIGEGYEYGNFVFYSTEEGDNGDGTDLKSYTILEYNGDTLQRLFILGRDLLER